MAKTLKSNEIGFTDNAKGDFLNCETTEKLRLFLDRYDLSGFDKFGNNILHYYLKNIGAFKLGWREIIPEILRRGLGIDQKQSSGNGQSPLHIAIQLKEKDIFAYLIESGADVNSTDANGNSPIWIAVMGYRGDGYFVETLLQHGADGRIKNNAGVSAIKLAKTIANYDVEKYF